MYIIGKLHRDHAELVFRFIAAEQKKAVSTALDGTERQVDSSTFFEP